MPGSLPRALVVDDNSVNRELFGAILASQGLSVDFAVNGREAVVLAKAIAFDLIFMDFQMPLMDGVTATALIREEERQAAKPRARLFIVSACGEQEVGLKARLAGADGFIAKPVSFARVVDLAHGSALPEVGSGTPPNVTVNQAPSDLHPVRAG